LSDPIPVIVDIPAALPRLGFDAYAEALAGAIRGGEPPQFTVGLYGSWGSGKSTLLKAVAAELQRDETVIVAEFDAWRYERSEHIIVPLLHRIHGAVAETGDNKLLGNVRKALESIVFSLNFKLAFLGIDAKSVKEHWEREDLPQLDSAFAEPFAALERIPSALGDRRIVVLIDDLDRCSPEKVVSVLEAINVVMDVPGLIFVLALDYDVLTEAVRARYPHVRDPHVFIEKMVQLPFRVPPLDIRSPTFLEELVPNWQRTFGELPEFVASSVVDIADYGLQRNPRQLKRLINAFLVIRRVIELRRLNSDDQVLLATIGLQLRWPEQYRTLQAAVMVGAEDPIGELLTEVADGHVERYLRRFFADREAIGDDLRRILEFTSALAVEPEGDVDPWEVESFD
jgi:predicted KAP-like P-loop ATPase